jgi:fumarate reductase subunit D
VRRSNEPFFWAMFSAGGMITALLAPALIVLTGLLLPWDVIELESVANLLGNALIRLVILVVFALALLHWANRFRHTLVDMGLKSAHTPISVLSYVVAVAGIAWSALVLFG